MEIELGKNSQFFVEITIMTRPPICFLIQTENLDGVGPVDNRPSIEKLHHFVQKKRRRKKVTSDMWHVTHDTWHVTCDETRDTWHVTCFGGWTFSQNFSSLALTVCDLWYYEDLEEKDEWINELMNQWMTRLFIEQPRLHRVC